MNKKTFELSWDSELGPEWMNIDNLMVCLNSTVKPGLLKIKDVSQEIASLQARIVELEEEVKSFNRILAGGSELDQEYLRKHKAVQAYKQALSTPPEELAREFRNIWQGPEAEKQWEELSDDEKSTYVKRAEVILKILNRKAKGE